MTDPVPVVLTTTVRALKVTGRPDLDSLPVICSFKAGTRAYMWPDSDDRRISARAKHITFDEGNYQCFLTPLWFRVLSPLELLAEAAE